MNKKQYAGVCCYFGQWPSYFQFWLNSCAYNSKIDFYLVSDIAADSYVFPENVILISKTFTGLQELVKSKFPDLNVSLDRPYKLCDFKTAYGYLFEDIFEGYDYWGFFDIDTIWGNIVKFIPENLDSHLIKIFPCGHLSFIRNISPWNKIYELVNQVAGTPCRNNMSGKAVATWQECFSSSESFYYDEEGGLEPLMSVLIVTQYGGVDFDNILPPWRFDHFYSINFPEKSHFLVYSFEEGTLCRHYLEGLKVKREEISYLHISKRNLSPTFRNANKFVIYPKSIAIYKKWTLASMVLLGHKRYLMNFIRRSKYRMCSMWARN